MSEAAQVMLSVLIVEDDELVREATVGSVMDLGHQVLEAADADAALQMLEGDAAVDVLLTDVRLPGKSGEELAQEAWRRRPNLKVIFTSGAQAPDEAIEPAGISVWLDKPYRWADLKRAFEQLHERRD